LHEEQGISEESSMQNSLFEIDIIVYEAEIKIDVKFKSPKNDILESESRQSSAFVLRRLPKSRCFVHLWLPRDLGVKKRKRLEVI
jgi:hypothetical protein